MSRTRSKSVGQVEWLHLPEPSAAASQGAIRAGPLKQDVGIPSGIETAEPNAHLFLLNKICIYWLSLHLEDREAAKLSWLLT